MTFADAHKSRRNEGTVEFASRRDMEVGHFTMYDCDHDPNTYFQIFGLFLLNKETVLLVDFY